MQLSPLELFERSSALTETRNLGGMTTSSSENKVNARWDFWDFFRTDWRIYRAAPPVLASWIFLMFALVISRICGKAAFNMAAMSQIKRPETRPIKKEGKSNLKFWNMLIQNKGSYRTMNNK